MRILFLSRWFPFPADNGAKIRVFNLIKSLAQYHEIRLVTFTSEPVSDDRAKAMREFCYQMDVVLYTRSTLNKPQVALAFMNPSPRNFAETHNPEFLAHVDRAGREEKFDLILGSAWDSIPYMLGAESIKKTPKILEEVEISIYRDQWMHETDPLKKLRKQMMWNKWKYFMARSLKQLDGCTVVSQPEILPIHECLPNYAPVFVSPNGADVQRFTGDFGVPIPNTLVYTGAMTYYVNFDAMKFFLGQVFPLVLQHVPEAKLSMYGKTDGVPLHELPKCDNAVLAGYTSDIRLPIAQSWLSIVPERLGGGTRIKVPESMALGTPVVSTTRGATGLNLQDGYDALIADEPAAFAQHIARLLKDPALRTQLSQHGRKTVEDRFDWRVIGKHLSDFLIHVVQQHRHSTTIK